MKHIFKMLISHLKYTLKESHYIFKISFTHNELATVVLPLSFKFLFHQGIKNLISKKIFKNYKLDYSNYVRENMTFSNDWFSHNITTWVSVFKKEIKSNKRLDILEIGSYEGASVVFLLKYFQTSSLQCVETFEGSDEHKDLNFNEIKKNFYNNTSTFKERLSVFEGTSDEFFLKNKQIFDIIYVDGSHEFSNVYKDAFNSFNFLNINGIIIFDDFLKKYYGDLKKDPIIAILNFISKHKKNIKILNVGYQIIIKKIR